MARCIVIDTTDSVYKVSYINSRRVPEFIKGKRAYVCDRYDEERETDFVRIGDANKMNQVLHRNMVSTKYFDFMGARTSYSDPVSEDVWEEYIYNMIYACSYVFNETDVGNHLMDYDYFISDFGPLSVHMPQAVVYAFCKFVVSILKGSITAKFLWTSCGSADVGYAYDVVEDDVHVRFVDQWLISAGLYSVLLFDILPIFLSGALNYSLMGKTCTYVKMPKEIGDTFVLEDVGCVRYDEDIYKVITSGDGFFYKSEYESHEKSDAINWKGLNDLLSIKYVKICNNSAVPEDLKKYAYTAYLVGLIDMLPDLKAIAAGNTQFATGPEDWEFVRSGIPTLALAAAIHQFYSCCAVSYNEELDVNYDDEFRDICKSCVNGDFNYVSLGTLAVKRLLDTTHYFERVEDSFDFI